MDENRHALGINAYAFLHFNQSRNIFLEFQVTEVEGMKEEREMWLSLIGLSDKGPKP